MMQNYEKWRKKYFTTSDCNKFASNILDAKITQKEIVNNLVQTKRKKILGTKEELKTLVTKAVSK